MTQQLNLVGCALMLGFSILLSACGTGVGTTATPISKATIEVPAEIPTIPYPYPTLDIVPTGVTPSVTFTGSVTIEQGMSMVGTVIGGKIDMWVWFEAESSAAPVSEMRVDDGTSGGCRDEKSMAAFPWRSRTLELTYSTTASSGIQSYYVSAQYRDNAGNVSPVYCDDISIEGMPPTPEP